MRQFGHWLPLSGVPQTKHWERGRGTMGVGPARRGARSGSGGGGVRGGGTGALGVVGPAPTAGAVSDAGDSGAASFAPDGVGAFGGLVAGAPLEGFAGAGFAAGAGFLGGSSASLRRRRKNDIAPQTERRALSVTGPGTRTVFRRRR